MKALLIVIQFKLSIAYVVDLKLFELFEGAGFCNVYQACFAGELLFCGPLLGDAGAVEDVDDAVFHPLVCAVDGHVYCVSEEVCLTQTIVEFVVDVSLNQHFLRLFDRAKLCIFLIRALVKLEWYVLALGPVALDIDIGDEFDQVRVMQGVSFVGPSHPEGEHEVKLVQV